MSDEPKRLTPEGLAEIRRMVPTSSKACLGLLIDHIDAIEAELAAAKQRAERAEYERSDAWLCETGNVLISYAMWKQATDRTIAVDDEFVTVKVQLEDARRVLERQQVALTALQKREAIQTAEFAQLKAEAEYAQKEDAETIAYLTRRRGKLMDELAQDKADIERLVSDSKAGTEALLADIDKLKADNAALLQVIEQCFAVVDDQKKGIFVCFECGSETPHVDPNLKDFPHKPDCPLLSALGEHPGSSLLEEIRKLKQYPLLQSEQDQRVAEALAAKDAKLEAARKCIKETRSHAGGCVTCDRLLAAYDAACPQHGDINE